MKKLSLLLLPIFVFSSEITFDKKFKSSLLNDELKNTISINFTKVDLDEALQINKKYEKFISENKNVSIKSFDNSLMPIYHDNNKKENILKYQSKQTYKVTANSLKHFNSFLSSLHDEKDENNLFILSSDIIWKASKKTKELAKDKLRLESIVWINKYSKSLSKEINKSCKVKNISIKNRSHKKEYLKNKTQNKNYKSSIRNKNSLKIYASYTLQCL